MVTTPRRGVVVSPYDRDSVTMTGGAGLTGQAVVLTTAGQREVELASDGELGYHGVLAWDAAEDDENVLVYTKGRCPVKAGATFLAGVELEVDSDGNFVTRTTGRLAATSVEAAAAIGDLVIAELAHEGGTPPGP